MFNHYTQLLKDKIALSIPVLLEDEAINPSLEKLGRWLKIEKTIPLYQWWAVQFDKVAVSVSLRLSLPQVEEKHYLDKLRNKDSGQWEREGRTVFKLTLTVAEYSP